MKKLQNNFTTPEQSKRLLDLGVPADSADCYYEKLDVDMICIEIRQENAELKKSWFYNDDYHPCWSVGRLIEICLRCSTLKQRQVLFFYNGDDDYYNFMSHTINVLESGIITDHMDFSKLEN